MGSSKFHVDEEALSRLISDMLEVEKSVQEHLIDGAFPRLWFGDLEAYCKPERRIVTVGLNPSGNDFRQDNRRIEAAVDGAAEMRAVLIDGTRNEKYKRFLAKFPMSEDDEGYDSWFNNYRVVLQGLDRSYEDVLHVDICSPFATEKTWSKLGDCPDGRRTQRELLKRGFPLFTALMGVLKPHLILVSVNAEAMRHWECSRSITKRNLAGYEAKPPRKRLFSYRENWGECTVISGAAGVTPFQMLTHEEKLDLAATITAHLTQQTQSKE